MGLESDFQNVSKERFRIAANKLLNECFILKKLNDTKRDYDFIYNNQKLFSEYFEVLGYDLLIDEKSGVICLNNPQGTGRLQFKKIESIILLILRVLFLEKRREISQAEDVVVLIDEIYDKYNTLQLKARIDKVTMRSTMGMFKRMHLVTNLNADMADPDTRIIILPSILFALSSEGLDSLYENAKDRLNKYKMGGDEDGVNDETDEEID